MQGHLSIEKLHLQLWKFDLQLVTSDVPDLHFGFSRPACCTPSCNFSCGTPCQWKPTGHSKVEGIISGTMP